MKENKKVVTVLRNRVREIPIKSIKVSPLDIGQIHSASVYRLADKIGKGKACPILVVNETTGHFIGNRVVLYAMRELSYKKVPVIMLKLSRAEELAVFQSFSKWI